LGLTGPAVPCPNSGRRFAGQRGAVECDNIILHDDEMVLEAAVASGAGWIVTHNVRDLVGGATRYGVEVLTPAEALRWLGVVR
jgi:hypothetical protein